MINVYKAARWEAFSLPTNPATVKTPLFKAAFLLALSPSPAKFGHLLPHKLPLLQAWLLALRVFEQAIIPPTLSSV